MGLMIYYFVYEEEIKKNNDNTILNGKRLITLKDGSFYQLLLPVRKVVSVTSPAVMMDLWELV